MLYNAIEGAVAGWSRNSLPVLIKLFGVPVTVIRQVAIEDTDDDSTVVEPAPVPEPTPEPVVEPEPVEEEEEYVPPAPTAPTFSQAPALQPGSRSQD